MNSKLCFLHLSDIHFKKYNQEYADVDDDLRHELLNDIRNHAIKELHNISGILVCGDIAHSGKANEYEQASSFLNKICEIFKLEESKVYCVPGNHDVDQEGCKNDPILLNTQSKLESTTSHIEVNATITEYLSSSSGSGQILFNHLNNYNTCFAEKYGCKIDAKKPYWTYQLKLDDTYSLNIRGINSVIISSHLDHIFAGNERKMVIGEYQVPIKDDNIINMTLCHHPPDCWKDPENKLVKFINDRVHIQLYGHKHIQTIYQNDNTLVVGSGSMQPSRAEDKWFPCYNWITLELISSDEENEYIEFKLYPRKYNLLNNRFGADLENCHEGKLYNQYKININDNSSEVHIMTTDGSEKKLTIFSIDDVNDKDLIYHFMSLPYIKRSKLLDKYNVINELDEGKKHIDILYKVLNEIKVRNCKQEFWDDIMITERGRN
ncbi:hypothetical protein AGMMS49942_29210 [Spirochaetia bacterium]|nr:hypothetical protein AGMMS49942_29210 [Spirochaetia bacterium]